MFKNALPIFDFSEILSQMRKNSLILGTHCRLTLQSYHINFRRDYVDDYVTIADDHRKFVNQNQRIYDMEESMRKCIEIRAKQAFLNEEKEEKMMYELIEKKQMAAELQKVRFW